MYTLALDQSQPVTGPVTFTVTRDEPDTSLHPTVWWVYVRCTNAAGKTFWPVNELGQQDFARVVAWGLQSSMTGQTTPIAVQGVSAVAWLTDKPWVTKVGKNSVTFSLG